ncbi:MAG TPA: SMC-Scp complex subunit ScpB [Dehalococcoidia bacterium]|nr:SMC-Scp complex subunit ScpB [Dehalococcoidia bacterium]
MKRLPRLDRDSLPLVLEGILFVADAPVDTASLARVLRRPREDVEAALADLESHYERRGLRLQRSNGLVQMVSAPEAGPYIERFLGEENKQRLSGAALECLAIIAYRQPVTRAGVEAVRGVNSDGAIASLIARGLIEEVGRAPGPGRPALLGTTMKFLEHFGLKDPSDLPPLPEQPSPPNAQPRLTDARGSGRA